MKIILSLIMFISTAYGSENFSLSAMTSFQSQKIYRGAQIWEWPGMTVGVSAVIFKRLEIRGPLIDFHFFERSNNIELDVGLRFFTDSEPMIPLEKGFLNHRNKRGDALDLLVHYKYKFGWRNLFAIGVDINKELIEHEGSYYRPFIEFPILPYTKLSIAAGYGSIEANKFVYGPSAISGLGHLDITLSNVLVQLPWDGIIITQFGVSYVKGQENINADYIRGNDQNNFVSTRIIWKFY